MLGRDKLARSDAEITCCIVRKICGDWAKYDPLGCAPDYAEGPSEIPSYSEGSTCASTHRILAPPRFPRSPLGGPTLGVKWTIQRSYLGPGSPSLCCAQLCSG